MSNELTLQEAALAWAHGKRVECLTVNQTEYFPISRVGTSDGILSPTCFGERDDDRIRYKFRLAPEPPAKKWRPWTPEEVPLDAWFKAENGIGFKLSYADLWTVIDSPTVANANGSHMDLGSILKLWKHSTDNGKTWLPCGVEVEA